MRLGYSQYDVVISNRGFEKFRLRYRIVLPRSATEARVFAVDYAPVSCLARIVKLLHGVAGSVCRDLLRLSEVSNFVDAANVRGDIIVFALTAGLKLMVSTNTLV